MLEFAALDPEAGEALLNEHRPALELVRARLHERGSAYARSWTRSSARCRGRRRRSSTGARRAAEEGPPDELVGLEPFGAGGRVSRLDYFLWVVVPYLCVAIFVVGHVWRYRRDQYTWTARSTQLLERRLLRAGSILFHFGILAAIGGHVLGILVPRSWTSTVGISDDAYHWIAVAAGGLAGAAIVARLRDPRLPPHRVGRVRATTTRSDLVLYPVLARDDRLRDARDGLGLGDRRAPLPRDGQPVVPRDLHLPTRTAS